MNPTSCLSKRRPGHGLPLPARDAKTLPIAAATKVEPFLPSRDDHARPRLRDLRSLAPEPGRSFGAGLAGLIRACGEAEVRVVALDAASRVVPIDTEGATDLALDRRLVSDGVAIAGAMR